MSNKEVEKIVDERLETLLRAYHHNLFMTNNFRAFFSWFAGMSLGGFMEWLKSKNR